MTAEHEEVSTQSLHIDRRVGDGLSTVNQHGDVVRMSNLDDTLHIVDGAEGVIHMAHADEPRTRRDDALELRENQVAILVGGDGAQCGTLLLSHALPGHDVGVMVELANDDVIARRQELSAVGLRHEVDALGGTTHEDDLLAGGGVDEPLHLFTGLFVSIRCTGSKSMRTAVDVRIIITVIVRDLVDDQVRLLRRGTIVEPHKVVAVHLLVEHGEVALNLLRVKRVGLLVVQVAQLLRLRDADAETVILGQRRGLFRLMLWQSIIQKRQRL